MNHWTQYRMNEARLYRVATFGDKGARYACMLAKRASGYHARAFFAKYGF